MSGVFDGVGSVGSGRASHTLLSDRGLVRAGDHGWEAVFFDISTAHLPRFPTGMTLEDKGENAWPMFIHAHLRQRWKRRNILGWESWSDETGGNGRQSFDCGDESGVIY